MRAMMVSVPESLLTERRRTGADRWDEMWEGVLHMPPMPSREHQQLEGELEMWLRQHWARPFGNKVYHQINVASAGGWPDRNYRIPDLVLLTPDRFAIDKNHYFDGGPTVVVEIRSSDDETYEKLEFYADAHVLEVWVIDAVTRQPEVYLLQSGSYFKQGASADNWLSSPATGVCVRPAAGERLEIQLGADEATRRSLPED